MTSPANRPAAMAAEPARALHDEDRSALGTRRRRSDDRAAGPGDQHLALATPVAIDGDPLAAKLVRELVRSFDIRRGGRLRQVDGLADRRVHATLKHGLHLDVRRDVDLVRRREPALDVGGHLAATAYPTVLGDCIEQRPRAEPALGGEVLERRVDLGELGAVEDVAAIRERVERLDPGRAPRDDADGPGR